MRKLASIQRVTELKPIPDADAIELAVIQGWQCVVKKGEWEVGDLGVYFEIDAQPPNDDRYRFMWDRTNLGMDRPNNYRVKTMKLRGALSQGVLMPLSEFRELDFDPDDEHKDPFWPEEGTDVTEILGVTKYDPPIPAEAGQVAGSWNFECFKTDEERIQSSLSLLEVFRGKPWVATVKLDGCSMTMGTTLDGTFGIAGRNWMAKDGDNMFWNLCHKKLDWNPDPNYIYQGELVGPGIQKNPLELKDLDFYVFNVYDIYTKTYLAHDAARWAAVQSNLNFVPLADRGDSFDFTLEQLLEMAEGVYPGTKRQREGLVFRLVDEPMYGVGEKKSFKVINNAHLLKEKD